MSQNLRRDTEHAIALGEKAKDLVAPVRDLLASLLADEVLALCATAPEDVTSAQLQALHARLRGAFEFARHVDARIVGAAVRQASGSPS